VDNTEGERWRDEQPVAAQSTDATLAWAEFQEFSVTVGNRFTVVEVIFSSSVWSNNSSL